MSGIMILHIQETFDWTNEEGTVSISFNITAMLSDIERGALKVERITAPIDVHFALAWVSKRDINFRYCEYMSKERRNAPVLGVWMPNETVLLIDGSHRYWAKYQRCEETIDYNLVNPKDWKPYATIKGELK